MLHNGPLINTDSSLVRLISVSGLGNLRAIFSGCLAGKRHGSFSSLQPLSQTRSPGFCLSGLRVEYGLLHLHLSQIATAKLDNPLVFRNLGIICYSTRLMERNTPGYYPFPLLRTQLDISLIASLDTLFSPLERRGVQAPFCEPA